MSEFLDRISKLSPKKLALLARDLQSKLDSLEKERREPIAIIGMGCRFPGGANSPEEFWRLLRDGVDAITEVPPERWDINSVYDPEPGKPGKMCTRYGGFIKEVDRFDPLFFGISPREAESMDPQQRLVLEVCWETIENAGQSPEKLAGTKTGVYVGICSSDYTKVILACDPTALDMYLATGSSHSIASGRLSYTLGLHGPSISLDTACSSSLVAVHLACVSLRARECQAALAGGVSLMLSPEATIMFSKSRMMANDGRCKTFDAAADGYVRGEGCGMVLLKRLSDAITNGDNILALVQSSAINQDGRSGGITAPNGLAQQAVIREALLAAHLEPHEVDYVETHGTGTPLGDPIEVGALGAVFGGSRPKENPLHIGSVKTNIGHAEGAAGVAGLIKLVLALQNKQIPPHLHLKQLSPYTPWEEFSIDIPTQLTPWPARSGQRIGAVSSLGFSGTNAHVIVSGAPELKRTTANVDRSHHLLTLSAKSAGALKELVVRYERHLAEHPEVPLSDVCYTANTGRSHFEHRLAMVASSKEQLQQSLASWAAGQEPVGVLQGRADLSHRPEVVFLSTGQGGQYVNMGRGLYECEPVFRQVVDRCEELLRPHLAKPLRSVLYPQPGEVTPLDETAYTHVAMFAVQYGLAELWRSWGVEPGMVMGHSVGEIVAATVAGVMSLEDGLMIMRERGRLMQSLPATGMMASLLAGEERVAAALAPYRDRVAIAAVNGPESTVISGERAAMQEILQTLEAEGIKTKPLKVSNSFHSPLVEPVLEEFEKAAARAAYRPPQMALFSSMRLEMVGERNLLDAAYWRYNLRHTVRFSEAMRKLYAQGYRVFLEIGPSPTLVSMGSQCVPEGQGVWLPSLRQDRNDWEQILESLGTLYIHGTSVDWAAFDKNYPRRRVVLPTYPFQRERFAIDIAVDGSRGKGGANISLPSGAEKLQALARAKGSLRAEWSASPEEPGGFGVIRLIDEQNKVVAEISSRGRDLSHAEEIGSDAQPNLNNWLYGVEWEPQSLSRANKASYSTPAAGRKWLILADRHGNGEALASLLRDRGDHCILAFAERPCKDSTDSVSALNPTRPDDFQRLVQKVIQTPGSSWEGIIHLWSLDCTINEHLSVDSLEKSQFLSCGSVLHLIQSLKDITTTQPPRMWLVTRGVQPIGPQPGPVEVAQGPVRGLCRVIAMEHPELHCISVDMDPSGYERDIHSLFDEIWSASEEEDQVAIRRGVRYVARLKRAAFQTGRHHTELSAFPQGAEVFKRDATYLITGGLGDLGLMVARWMVGQGARHLVLMGRHAPSPQARECLNKLEQAGAEIVSAQADVSRPEDVERVLSEIDTSMPPLRGVIHAAGVWEGGVLLQQDWKRFLDVMAPKVQGAWILHELTQSLPLEFFVCFSSGASVLGAAGLGDYAAANSFLDALAHYRQAKGLPGSSINWGPWAELGMVTSVTELDTHLWSEHGMSFIPPDQALRALEQVLREGTVQIAILPINWAKLQSGIPSLGASPFLNHVVGESAKTSADLAAASTKRPLTAELLLTTDPAKRQQLLESRLCEEVARVLRLPISKLDVARPLNHFGLDSLMALELRNRMQARVGVTLPLASILSGPTVSQLVTVLAEKLAEAGGTGSNSITRTGEEIGNKVREDSIDKPRAQQLLAKLPELSDEEVNSLLSKMVTSKEGGQ